MVLSNALTWPHSFDPDRQHVRCYNLVACEAVRLDTGNSVVPPPASSRSRVPSCDDGGLRDVLSPELSLPVLPEVQVSRAQVRYYWFAITGSPLLVRYYWFAIIGSLLLVRYFWFAIIGSRLPNQSAAHIRFAVHTL